MHNYRVLVAAYPFCEDHQTISELFEPKGITPVCNRHEHKLTMSEIAALIADVDAVIAGVEGPYGREVIEAAKHLKAICRIGSGYDNIDLAACRDRNITVTYTPDTAIQSVAELTVANMLNLSRHIPQSDHLVHAGTWRQTVGRLLGELTIGIIGLGRIGKRVMQLLQAFGPAVIAHDIAPDEVFARAHNIAWRDKQQILEQSDLITLHISYSENNYHYINDETIQRMKEGVLMINTSRGPVVDETALLEALREQHIAAAALDVFEHEPYSGPLAQLDNCVLTPHIGNFAKHSLYSSRIAACEECIRILSGEEPKNQVSVQNSEE